VSLQEEEIRTQTTKPKDNRVRTEGEDGHLQSKERSLSRNKPVNTCPRLPASRIVRK